MAHNVFFFLSTLSNLAVFLCLQEEKNISRDIFIVFENVTIFAYTYRENFLSQCSCFDVFGSCVF